MRWLAAAAVAALLALCLAYLAAVVLARAGDDLAWPAMVVAAVLSLVLGVGLSGVTWVRRNRADTD